MLRLAVIVDNGKYKEFKKVNLKSPQSKNNSYD